MNVLINILNYVDTVKVFVDGIPVGISNLSFLSKAIYTCDVEPGHHEICIKKAAESAEQGWKRKFLYDWISTLSGLADWTMVEKNLDTKVFSMVLDAEAESDIQISLSLTENGFEVLNKTGNIVIKSKQTEIDNKARRRILIFFHIPIYTVSIVIGLLFAFLTVLFLLTKRYIISILMFSVAIFWTKLTLSPLTRKGKSEKNKISGN